MANSFSKKRTNIKPKYGILGDANNASKKISDAIVKVNESRKKQIVKHAEDDWVYLIHHMHPPEGKGNVKYKMEELHHCPMFEKKNTKGKKYDQMHIKDNRMLLHGLDIKDNTKFPSILYDHLNNAFPIVVMEIDNKRYAIITEPKGKLIHDEYEKK